MGVVGRTAEETIVDQEKSNRGRPRSAAKTAAVLDAASDLFLTLGYEGTSMDEVARCAGVSKQTVYSHFSSKETLFGAAVRSRIEKYAPEVALKSVETDSLHTSLCAVGYLYARLLMSPESISLFRLLASSADHPTSLAKPFWESGPAELIEELMQFLAAWRDRGALAFDDGEEAAADFVALIDGGLQFKLAIGLIDALTKDQIKQHVERCVSSFLKLYGTRGPA